MIKTITKEQREKIPAFIEKWVSQVSKPMNEEKAIEYTTAIYKRMGAANPLLALSAGKVITTGGCGLLHDQRRKI